MRARGWQASSGSHIPHRGPTRAGDELTHRDRSDAPQGVLGRRPAQGAHADRLPTVRIHQPPLRMASHNHSTVRSAYSLDGADVGPNMGDVAATDCNLLMLS